MHFWGKWGKCFLLGGKPVTAKPPGDEELLREAHRAVMEAHNLLTRVQDEDMIDCAIYNLKAAEKRYDYLLRRIKEQHRASKVN